MKLLEIKVSKLYFKHKKLLKQMPQQLFFDKRYQKTILHFYPCLPKVD